MSPTATRDERIAEVDERLKRLDRIFNDPADLAVTLLRLLQVRQVSNPAYVGASMVCAGLAVMLDKLEPES